MQPTITWEKVPMTLGMFGGGLKLIDMEDLAHCGWHDSLDNGF